MPVSWKKKYNPNLVVDKIEERRKIGNDGKVTFEGWGYKGLVSVLQSMLQYSDEMPEINARLQISKAIFNTGSKGPITEHKLLAEINRLAREYQLESSQRYVLLTSISMSPSLVLPKLNLGKSQINFSRSLSPRFRKESNAIFEHAKDSLFASLPIDYLYVKVGVSAKSTYQAANQGLDLLDFVRGIWNWFLNRRYSSRMSFGGKPKPVNTIILGPLHTLHKINGELAAENNWWYETSYLGAIKPFSPRQDELEGMNRTIQYIKRIIRKHKYPEVIHNAFIRYTRALDERDWTTSFLKLWNVLELLTDTNRADYETMIKRIAFLYEERDYHLQVLQHLREFRNSSVHQDKESSDIETYLYQIKGYVELLIGFHINSRLSFQTIQEAGEFLSLPVEDKIIRDEIKKLGLARKFRGFA